MTSNTTELSDLVSKNDLSQDEIRQLRLEMLDQRDEIIGLRNENANLLAELNDSIRDFKLLSVEYQISQSRLATYNRIANTLPWKIMRKFYRSVKGRKPEIVSTNTNDDIRVTEIK